MSTPGTIATLRRAALLAAALMLGALPAGAVRAAALAMITDLEGEARLSAAGATRNARILAEIREDNRIELAPNARLVMLWLPSGEEFSFVGPAVVRFAAAGPQSLSGAPATRRPSAIEKSRSIRIDTAAVAQAAMVMRSADPGLRMRLLTPAGTRTLDPAPEFRWRPLPGLRRYRFELTDASGRALVETEVSGEAYRLPAEVRLVEGQQYSWGVSAQIPGGHNLAASADLSVATASQRAEVEAARPGAGAPLAERVAFAAWLEQLGLRDDARKYWQNAAAERPQEEQLKLLAGHN